MAVVCEAVAGQPHEDGVDADEGVGEESDRGDGGVVSARRIWSRCDGRTREGVSEAAFVVIDPRRYICRFFVDMSYAMLNYVETDASYVCLLLWERSSFGCCCYVYALSRAGGAVYLCVGVELHCV